MIKKIIITISILVFSILAYQASGGSSKNNDLKEEVARLRVEVAELNLRLTRLESQVKSNTYQKKTGGYGISK